MNVTPAALATVSSLRAQGFNINHIITLFPPTLENNSGIAIVSVNAFNLLAPKPKYIFIGLGWENSDFVYASQMLDIDRKHIVSLLDQNRINHLNNVFDIYMKHLPELYDFYSSLIDEESRQVFCGFMKLRVTGRFGDGIFANAPQYICEGFTPDDGDILIDGGACDGYTAEMFAKLGCKVYSFEMDRKNYELASVRGKAKGFVVENLGLGSFNREEHYTHVDGNIGGSHLDANGSDTTKIVTLDSYVADHQLPSVDFIKLDVEGAELDILKGAAESIKKFKPRMAICAYHKHEDLWTLMPFIKSLRPDYEFAFRHYPHVNEAVPFGFNPNMQRMFDFFGVDGRVPSIDESVLFCR